MGNKIKNYSDLLKEETRIKLEIESSETKIEESFKIDLSPKSIFGFVRNILPFNFGSTNKNESLDLHTTDSDETSFHDNDSKSEPFVNLALDLAYESLSLLLLRKSSKEKEDSYSRTSTTIKLLLKSIVDKYYYEHREVLGQMLSNLVEKGKEKFKMKMEKRQEEREQE